MTAISHSILRALLPVWLAGAGACVNTPDYIGPREALEVGIPDPNAPGETIDEATTQLVLPVRLETMDEAMERAEAAMDLGVDVPFVDIDDLSISIEWTIKNLADQAGQARIHVNGGNERFAYVPDNFIVDPDDDTPPPPLLGNVPIEVPASASVSGVFREDQLVEAAVDLELITRGGLNPFAALLQFHGDLDELSDENGMTVPRSAFGHLVQYDLRFLANRHMVFEYEIRVRDHAGILHERLLDAPAGELTAFMPEVFVPPPPMEP